MLSCETATSAEENLSDPGRNGQGSYFLVLTQVILRTHHYLEQNKPAAFPRIPFSEIIYANLVGLNYHTKPTASIKSLPALTDHIPLA